MTTRQPVLFIGHGSPMNAIEDTASSRSWRALGESLTTPSAILVVSAHWYGAGTFVTGQTAPPTIHDFGGFPKALFDMQYPAVGQPELAARISKLLQTSPPTTTSDAWGLDHGTWSVLVHLRPKADVPVVQLSIDARLPASAHVALGKSLSALRNDNVLILGSGNVTHNLREAMNAMRSGDTTTPPWAVRFDADVTTALEQHDGQALTRMADTDDGRRAHPTPDHWLPMLYAVGAGGDDAVTFPTTGFDAGSLSMRSVRFG